jgi:hypothetical protein
VSRFPWPRAALTPPVNLEASKDGVKFACTGDIGNGAVTLRSHTNVDKPELNVSIELSEPVSLSFSLKYLVNFCKASGLSSTVKLCLAHEVPLLVEYNLVGSSYLRFYLAPKVGNAPLVTQLTGRLAMRRSRGSDRRNTIAHTAERCWPSSYRTRELATPRCLGLRSMRIG